MLRFSTFLLCLTVLSVVKGFKETIETNTGPIRGRVLNTVWYNKPYYSYRGVPFAKPPVGELRFKAPEPIEKWTEPINAFEYGIWCAQPSKEEKGTSEDCLTLNVFVPVSKENRKLPVLFLIPGGNFATGSGSDFMYGADFMMEHDVILVTTNYRMGVFGFMSLGLPEYSGNMGIKDQQLAMKWIFENIEAFGGDPKRITLGGLSSGSASVGLHMLNKESSKYFQQILVISGAPNRYHTYQKGDHKCLITQLYNKFFKGQPSDKELVNFMKNVNASEIIKFFNGHYTRKYTPWNWIVEKKTAKRPIIVDESMAVFQKTKSINKPAYYTVTHYEHLSRFVIAGTDYLEPAAVRKYINDFSVDLPIFGYRSLLDRKPDFLKDVLKEFKDYYIKINASTTDRDLLVQRMVLDSDVYYLYCIEKWIERHVAISTKDTYYHRFSAHTVNSRHPEFSYDFPAAGHADDVPYAFRGTLFYNPKNVWEKKDTDADHALAFKVMNLLQKLYTNFIKYGKPVINGDPMPEFKPIKRSSKADQFDFVDVTNSGLIPRVSASEGRTKFLDQLIEKVQKLVKKHGQTPKKTQIEQLCDVIKAKANQATSSKK